MLKIILPSVAVTLIGFVIAYQFVEPAPPSHVTIAAGSTNGAYYACATAYRELLAENGIEVTVLATAGTRENLALLAADGGADVAFVQTGVATGSPPFLALGSLYLEPLWVIYRGAELDALTELTGKRLAIGPDGSGTRALALTLLSDCGIGPTNATLLELTGEAASAALQAGEIDAAFFVMSPTSPLIAELLASPDIWLMSFRRAPAICNRHRHLSPVVLYQGVMDLARNIPPSNHILVSAAATLVVRADFHPALMDLLLDAAARTHGQGNWIEAPGAFPSPQFVEFELADQARDFYASGRSFLQRVFPFWAATLINRFKIMLIPLLTLLIPLLKLVPPLYQWRVRRRINRWYKALQELETAVAPGAQPERADELVAEIVRIEEEVAKVTVPPAYGDNLYQLRFHTSIARQKLEALKRSAQD
ncbi:MAG: ABC transporter substrate-binding protein [Lentisphaerae bacterium]|nr:ABC transporter substrate-binding protein [Lentisphaerota bacterium]